MKLSGLLPLIHDIPAYRELVTAIRSKQGSNKVAVLNAAKPFLVACLYHDLRLPVLVITARSDKARQLYDQLLTWCGDRFSIQLLPEPDALPYERLTSDITTVQQRLRILSTLSKREPAPLILTSAHALIRKTIPAVDFASACHILKKGMAFDWNQMLSRWVSMGYELESAVEVPGTISRRGGIIDIYPPHNDSPFRIELFGDEVESIRLFDPATQRSLQQVPEAFIVPAKEMLLPERGQGEEIIHQLALSTLDVEARERIEEEMTLLLQGQWFDGMEFYAALFNRGSFLDYLPPDSVVILDEPNLVAAEVAELESQAAELRRGKVERGQLPQDFPTPYLTWPELMKGLGRLERQLSLEEWGDESHRYHTGFAPAPDYAGGVSAFIEEAKAMISDGHRVIVVSQQASRLSELFLEQDVIAFPSADIEQLPRPGSITLVQGSLAEGWMAKQRVAPTALFSDAEIFGFTKKRRIALKRPMRHEAFLSEFSPGEYVVHIDHGIAKFSGATKMSLDGKEREYLILEYAEGDRLYLPPDQVDRISRYIGPRGYIPTLSRLGTQEWLRAKQRVKQAAGDLARELVAIYATREVSTGFAFSADSTWQQELEASFPYIETPDQLEAVNEVKQDMERPRPMDRLICGDVGYGKTEVALRAAFKAVIDGMQVALLVPTTVLAQQHFTTFCQRLGAFPIRVEMLSRFRSPEEQQEVIAGLKSGAVDICIGTHRLLQKDVCFKNLGLVIIDEEQRFGVAHKERLKQLRKEVDVLTLSATPIPRTLHMSLTGIRDLSTMETPPEERLPIKSYVAEYDERLIREAILRELERDGQVFFVHNRVQSISAMAEKLIDLVPEARIAVAHGQMPEEALESVMLDFTMGKIDVLVCTTIIESGLDLPNVNTLIVNDSDKLGLTQLYQLRGRVGRGATRAYAYFLYQRLKRLTDAARKRLRTIFEATELGSGFRIAMRDLEIRGAGNLLGAEQSGHMGIVGFELYCRLLAEAVEELKAEREGRAFSPRPQAPTIDLPLPAYIPEEYITDLATRLALYQRLAKVSSSQEVEDIAHEFRDRFGAIPSPARNLLYLVRIKALGAQAGIQAISTERNQVLLKLGQGVKVDRALLQRSLGGKLKVGTNQLRLDIRQLGSRWPEVLEEALETIAGNRELSSAEAKGAG